jgi:hypothetical protein
MKLIPLNKGQFAQVDDQDFEHLKTFKWYFLKGSRNKTGYAYTRTPDRKTVYMHRLITGEKEKQVDHRDHDGLNNQRFNLRVASDSQNKANKAAPAGSSRFKGVVWNKGRSKWQAQIKVNKKRRYLGLFVSEEEAAKAYQSAASEMFGEFACFQKAFN